MFYTTERRVYKVILKYDMHLDFQSKYIIKKRSMWNLDKYKILIKNYPGLNEEVIISAWNSIWISGLLLKHLKHSCYHKTSWQNRDTLQ
jgi:hypothetical protein